MMIRRQVGRSLVGLAVAIVTVGCAPALRTHSRPADAVDNEISRVLAGLGPAVESASLSPVRYQLAERLGEYHTSGLVVVVIRDDSIRWVFSIGVATAGGNDSMTASTRFVVQSLHKPVTAYGTMRLVEQGVVALDRPIDDYLRRWHVPQSEFTTHVQPTLREILSHTAGFSVRGVPTYRDGEPVPTVLHALDARPPAKGSAVRIEYVPGTEQRYSGGGYTVLELLLEDVTGTDFPTLMKQLVLDPLAMQASRFTVRMPAEWRAQAATGHDVRRVPIPGRWLGMAAGGFVSTGPDLARFVIEVGRAWRGESKPMSRETARTMLSPQPHGWGLGFEVTGSGDSLSFSHSGSGGGFRTLIYGCPALRAGVVILANSDAANELRYEILRSVAREYGSPGPRTERRTMVALDAEARGAVLGSYAFSDSSVMRIFEAGGSVWARWKDEMHQRIYPKSATHWFAENATEFNFADGSANGFIQLEWSGDFGSFKARRAMPPR